MRGELLFSEFDFVDNLGNHKRLATKAVDDLDQRAFTEASDEDLKARLVEKFGIRVPRLVRESIYVAPPIEVEVDVTGRSGYDWSERSSVKGTRVVIHVPFEGEPSLFKCRPSSWTTNPPRAAIRGQELLLEYDLLPSETPELRQRYEREIARIDEWLQYVRADVDRDLPEIPGIIAAAISSRRARLQKNTAVVDSLGLPVKDPNDR